MDYDDFNIRLEPKGDDTFKVSVETPAGNDSSEMNLTRSVEKLIPMLQALGQSLRGTESEETDGAWATDTRGILYQDELVAQPIEIGKALYRDLFVGAAESKFNQSLGHVKGQQKGLRIKLHIDPEDPAVARLANLPWELLCHPDMGDQPFSLSTQTPLVRYLNSPRPLNLTDFHSPLRILVVVSNPQGVRKLDLDTEKRNIEDSWGNRDDVEVRFLPRATVQALSDELAHRAYHILHYMGHGDFDPIQGAGVLLMETDTGATDPVDGRTLGVTLQDAKSLRMVFVNACNTAQSTHSENMDPYAGIAAGLVMSGVPAVVAMQFPISDRAAIAFSSTLYPRLAHGLPLDTAVAEARKAIRLIDRNSPEWATPVLFMSAPNGDLFAEITHTAPASRGNQQRLASDSVSQDSVEKPGTANQPATKSIGRYGLIGAGVIAVAIAAFVISNLMNGSSIESRSALPDAAEHEQFIPIWRVGQVSDSEVDQISNYTLRTTLLMKMYAQTDNQQALNDLFQDVNSAAVAGEPAAAVVLYLASQTDEVNSYLTERGVTTTALEENLETASENGFGLATFWYADRLQQTLYTEFGSALIDPANERYLEYCDRLRLAAAQGLSEIAFDRADDDDCVL